MIKREVTPNNKRSNRPEKWKEFEDTPCLCKCCDQAKGCVW